MNEHKQVLAQQLDELILDHDQLQQSSESCHYLSITKIDEWEQESIVKIHQMADKLRQELKIKVEKHRNQFSQRLKQLSEELKKTRSDNDFMESDLQQLLNKFNKLKIYVASSPTIHFQDDILISKISIWQIPDDVFDMFSGDLTIKNDGQVVEHGPSVCHASIRGSDEYSSGQHRFLFKIESYNINKWIFFGVISHTAKMQSNTWAISSSYGWGGQDCTILNCAMHSGLDGYSCDFELNDIIELLLDCDNRTIRLTNQRTQRTHTMNIDLVKCPFPWHFHLNLFYPNDRVRILCKDNR
ncbi:unnamed protein product [Rotaria sp. Silwood2]|nr:unnamed protein product [Rotaria sp. Silwood2]CAF2964603.1 unnamed protein product [Rotaria sp. Silwood2]CAF4018680.1 unnamed protein product [Rotaria sp. Silwood2]CAF4049034.1 unnamed protein product [Rotaria sp. Silwood2]CAF4155733.1 unnamed protein product [Rotaria sp. Silwood2]